jgi:hypothetical protein
MAAMFAGAALLHLAFSETGWFYRYEAYLVALGLVVVACQVTDWMPREIAFVASVGRVFPRKVATAALVALLLYPLAVRGAGALWFTPQATNNIFEQQYQMGIFVRQYYQGSAVALNDIGAVNYLADIHCLDLWGLASLAVTTKRSRGSYHTEDIDILARQAGIRSAIVYDPWYVGPIGGLPRSWVNVGRWTIPNNVVVGDSTVSFYAVDPSEAPALIEHLRNFRDRLPPDVIQTGRYTQGP